MIVTRRQALATMLGAAGLLPALLHAEPPKTEVTVYKSPTCSCCTGWVEHLRKNGFVVTTRDVDDMNEIKQTLGVPPALASCHTAVVGKYVIEGHVPAQDIRRLLAKKPKVAGLAAPGMPAQSPGMRDGKPAGYDVIAFAPGRANTVFARY